MNEDFLKQLWITIQPIFISGCTFLGMASVFNWLKKRGFIGKEMSRLDRRKVNDETLTQLLKMYDQNTKYLHALVELHIQQKNLLEQDLGFHKALQVKIDEIYIDLKRWSHAL